jgi:predicted dithiol-disulfide oxidoreductase (DUF899 family)
MSDLHEKHFPGESPEYRTARNKLLETEKELRRKIEEVAALRRQLPDGGKIKEDYVFEELDPSGKVKQTKFSELFKPGKDTLIVYSFMFGPNDKVPCTSCSSIMDGVNGMIYHVIDRMNFVAVTKSDVNRIKEWSDKKGWNKIRFLSSGKNTYNADYFAENEKGSQLPVLNVFKKTSAGIVHFYATELLYVPPENGQDGRHVDMIWPLWNMYDYTPEGRGTEWYPRHSYDSK